MSIEDIRHTLQVHLDPAMSNSLHSYVTAAAVRAGETAGAVAMTLEGSEQAASHELVAELHSINADLEVLASRALRANEVAQTLFGGWTTAATQVVIPPASPVEQPAPASEPSKEGRHTPLDPNVDYTAPAIQAKLDKLLDRVFSPAAVGADASERILGHLGRYGFTTVRDALSVNVGNVTGSMGEKYVQILKEEIARICPEIPLTVTRPAAEIARFHTSLDTVPIQAVFPNHRRPDKGRVTVGELFDPETGAMKSYPRARFHWGGQETLAAFVADFKRARAEIEAQNAGETPPTNPIA